MQCLRYALHRQLQGPPWNCEEGGSIQPYGPQTTCFPTRCARMNDTSRQHCTCAAIYLPQYLHKKMVPSHQHIPLRCHHLQSGPDFEDRRVNQARRTNPRPHLTPRHPRPHCTGLHPPLHAPSRDAQNESMASKSCAGAAFDYLFPSGFHCAGAHLATRAHHPRSGSRVGRGLTNICSNRTRAVPHVCKHTRTRPI